MSNPIKQQIMETLFENNDFILKSTGHDYDFVGIIETKTDQPLTFFFSEELCASDDDDDDDDDELYVDETETELLDVYQGLKSYDDSPNEDGDNEEDNIAMELGATSYLRTRDDKSTGFLSDPRERGMFLALIKSYCPEKLERIAWA